MLLLVAFQELDMGNSQPQNKSSIPLKIVQGRDELNLAEFPLSAISTRTDPNQKSMVFEDRIFDKSRGDVVKRKLTISASTEYGLPTALDDEVILGLVQLTKLQNFAEPKVHFTRYQLIQILGWRDDSKSYARIEDALNRWMGVTLVYEKAWWNKQENSWVNEKFHILDRVSVLDRERQQTKRVKQDDFPFSSFVWNEVIFQSFRSGNMKSLDFEFYKSLDGSISKRLYRFLDKRFYLRWKLEFDLKELAWEHIGLSRNYDAANLKRKLQTAIKELEEKGFIVPVDPKKRFLKVSAGIWKVVFEKANQPKDTKTIATVEPRPDLVDELVSRGVSLSVASDIVANQSSDRIEEKIEVLDWMVSKKLVVQNPAGYLVKSIQQDYTLPEGYETKEQRAATAALKEKENEEKRAKVERERAKKEAEEKESQHRKQLVKDYWNSLNEEEQHELEIKAISRANDLAKQMISKESGMGEVLRQYQIDSLILEILQLKGAD